MPGRLLVAYSNSSNHVSTTAEYLDAIARYSQWDVRYAHVTHGAGLDFDLNEFDAVFNSYCARLPFDGYVSADYRDKLKSFRGVKVLAVQDEYEGTDKLKRAIAEIGFHVVLTCVPQESIERVYPRADFPGTQFTTVLTGYVPEHLAARGNNAKPLAERAIHIGYRGREIGAYYGRLGFLKFEIGRRMREICEARGIPHDIEWSNDKRVYGEGWYDFIASCRANLGSEGGSNVFDFDGALKAAYERLSAERGAPAPYEEFRRYTDPIEAQYDAGQLTPRLFEAAALKTPLILFPGRYLGLIEPDEHYLALAEDFSNVDAVLARLDDLDALEAMADRAYRRLVGSGEFSYRRFVALIDGVLEKQAKELALSLRPPSKNWASGAIGADQSRLAGSDEQPTPSPRHFVFFAYKHAAREAALYKREYERVNEEFSAEIARLNEIYPDEIARLNGEIAHLNDIYPAEFDRLNRAYGEEIARLQREIASVDRGVIRKYVARKLGKPLRLIRLLRRAARGGFALRILASDPLGRAALGEALRSGAFSRPMLVQLARVVAARGAASRWKSSAEAYGFAPAISPPVLSLSLGAAPAASRSVSPAEAIAALAGNAIERCVLRVDRNVAARSFLLSEGRYDLPDFLAWLRRRPARVTELFRPPGGSRQSDEAEGAPAQSRCDAR